MDGLILSLAIFAQISYVIPYAKDAGLSKVEKQRFIDLHNAYRLKVALGQQSGQPPAANMIAMEWDDRVMKGAQEWADTCRGWHNTNNDRRFEPFSTVGQDFTGNFGVDKSVAVWFGEVKGFSYNSMGCSGVCGHYTQIMWWNSVLVGCGYNKCKGRNGMTLTYCNVAPGGNTAFDGKKDEPYLSGKACTKCPSGYGHCMGGGLCASQAACANTDTKCECPFSSCENGGVFDAGSCNCKCKDGFDGARCDAVCKDNIDYCADQKSQGQCKWDANMWMWMGIDCRKTCDKCGSPIPKGHVIQNADGIKTNAKPVKDVLKTKLAGADRGKPTPPPPRKHGNCKNLSPDKSCDAWADSGNCKSNPAWMNLNCASSCMSCRKTQKGNCKNKQPDSKCDDWYTRGECARNKIWMSSNCASSCNTC